MFMDDVHTASTSQDHGTVFSILIKLTLNQHVNSSNTVDYEGNGLIEFLNLSGKFGVNLVGLSGVVS